jgi:hypothetical protein
MSIFCRGTNSEMPLSEIAAATDCKNIEDLRHSGFSSALDLPYGESFAASFAVCKLSDDSGRSANAKGTRVKPAGTDVSLSTARPK